MAKYLVETYYTCSFKVKHYLDELNEDQLSKLDQREDGKFEIVDIKLETRKTKNLENKNKANISNLSNNTQRLINLFMAGCLLTVVALSIWSLLMLSPSTAE